MDGKICKNEKGTFWQFEQAFWTGRTSSKSGGAKERTEPGQRRGRCVHPPFRSVPNRFRLRVKLRIQVVLTFTCCLFGVAVLFPSSPFSVVSVDSFVFFLATGLG